jgi:hypothetical protein
MGIHNVHPSDTSETGKALRDLEKKALERRIKATETLKDKLCYCKSVRKRTTTPDASANSRGTTPVSKTPKSDASYERLQKLRDSGYQNRSTRTVRPSPATSPQDRQGARSMTHPTITATTRH